MPNSKNIQKMIDAIEKQPTPIRMASFVARNDCGTTACLAGWANILRQDVQGLGFGKNNYGFFERFEFGDTDEAANWMGNERTYAETLFYDYRADYLTPDERKIATIRLLTRMRDGGRPKWDDIIVWTSGEGYRLKN